MTVQPTPFAVVVQQGKVLDSIDGHTQREETPEEYVRQEIAKSLVREYGYPKKHIAVEFTLRVVHEVHEGLQSLLSIKRMEASLTKVSAVRVRFSKSLASLRHRLSQANVLSTIQRLGRTSKPLA